MNGIAKDAFAVFSKWREAPANAFGSKNNPGVISDSDKASYSLIYDTLTASAEYAISILVDPQSVEIKSMNYSHKYGSRGHRPVDIWVSVCGSGSEDLARMPQVYIIASERGIELGFAISINEDDYHDPHVKARNRTIVPLINKKLPDPLDPMAVQLANAIEKDGDWFFNSKARLTPDEDGFGAWSSFTEMISDIKSDGSQMGGGSICKFYSINDLDNIDLSKAFSDTLRIFHSLLLACLPTNWDSEVLKKHDELVRNENQVVYDPNNIVDARDRVLTQIAQRRGQHKFRGSLLRAYSGKCTISGTSLEAVLEAAHITPYLGEQTNHVTNGLLLRCDIHTLFDLHLIKIEPSTFKIRVSPSLRGTIYWGYEGQMIFLPRKKSEYPSRAALESHFDCT